MPWPQLTDYQEAIQNPRRCFGDADLRLGEPVLDALGLPRPVTGGFASVYQITSGGRRFAVRCFNRPAPEAERRYHLIDQHLRAVDLPYMVDFDFMPRGIQVRGDWYPALKMEWLDGDPLHLYLERHLDRPWAIRLLAHQFARMCADLARAGIAHGDLQHGNILVVDGALRLIDYDGMFVPALDGLPSLELGHRNYQHPRRSERDFGPHLDHFAAWVIYSSLIALGHQPDLWRQLQAGDECLLFRREDFERPGASGALAALAGQSDAQAASLAAALRTLLGAPALDLVPPLERLMQAQAVTASGSIPVPEWAQANLLSSLGPGAVTVATPPASGADWLHDQVAEVRAVRLGTAAGVDRMMLLGAILATLAPIAGMGLGRLLPATAAAIAVSVALVAMTILAWRYASRGEVTRKRELQASHRALMRTIARGERSLSRIGAALDRIARDEAKALARLAPRLNDVNNRQAADLNRIGQRLKAADDRLDGERQRLLAAEANEEARALRQWQNLLMERHLARQWVMTAPIAGVGVSVKARLLAAGARTAADIVQVRAQVGGDSVEIVIAGVGPVRVPGIGPTRAAALAAWRRSVEVNYRATLPSALPPAQVAALRARFAHRRAALANQTAAAARDAQTRGDQVRLHYGRQRDQLDQQMRAVRDRHGRERARLDHDRLEQQTQLAEQQRRLDAVWSDLTNYRAVTVRAYVRSLVALPGSA